MARVRTSILWSFLAGVNHTSNMPTFRSHISGMDFSKQTLCFYPRSSGSNILNNCSTRQWHLFENIRNMQTRLSCPLSFVDTKHCKTDCIATSAPGCSRNNRMRGTILHCQSTLLPIFINAKSPYRTYSSDKTDTPSATISGESTIDNTDVAGGDWVDSLKLTWQSATDAVVYTGMKAKEASDKLIPYVQQILDSHPYLKEVIVPVGWTVSAALLAWLVMPRILRRFHQCSIQAPALLLSGKLPKDQVSYERSFWGALEDPVRYLITFMAFSQLCVMIAPTTIASQYIAQAWRGAVILSFVWFLHRWKTNVITHALTTQNIAGLDRERLLALDKFSSVGLFILGVMASAEACGVAVQSILTVGGIGGVATAFAARDILGNVLSGLSMQFSRPFSMGDTIKAGSIEGQVVEMGLTTTSLLNSERFPVIVPNSLFSSQVIVNKSRAQWRAMVTKIPVLIDDLDKIPQVSEDIKSMLRSHAKVFLGKEAPYCFLSHIENSYAELTIGCNLKHMSRDELFTTEQDILVKSALIIKKNGAKLGSTNSDRFSY